MADVGALTADELEALNTFLNAQAGEKGLVCPVSGLAVGITEWRAPDRVLVLPGRDGGPGLQVYPLTSPAGGVLLVSLAGMQTPSDRRDGDRRDDDPMA